MLKIAQEEIKWFIEYNCSFKDKSVLINRNVFQSSLLKLPISFLSWPQYEVIMFFNFSRAAIKCYQYYFLSRLSWIFKNLPLWKTKCYLSFLLFILCPYVSITILFSLSSSLNLPTLLPFLSLWLFLLSLYICDAYCAPFRSRKGNVMFSNNYNITGKIMWRTWLCGHVRAKGTVWANA